MLLNRRRPEPQALAPVDLKRLAVVVGAAYVVALITGFALPLIQPLDERLFLTINRLGDGPEWWYTLVHPHTPRYTMLTALCAGGAWITYRTPRAAAAAALACVVAWLASLVLLEPLQIIFDRDRPEEVLGTQVDRTHGRTWAVLPSYPSGHAIVTTAIVSAGWRLAPRLLPLLLAWLLGVIVSRMVFGAHFPTDVTIGALLGWPVGTLATAASARMLKVDHRWNREFGH